MHNIKKNRIVFIVFLTLSSNLFALNKDIFDMNISSSLGFINGQVKEYVFDENCKNTDNMLSRLDWDILFLPYFQLDSNFDFFKYLNLSVDGRIGIPTSSGNMQDYDWLSFSNPTELTNYSIHDNQVDMYYNWSVNLGLNIKTIEDFTLIPFLGFEYDYIYMSAFDGYGIYKPYTSKHYMKGKVISYSQLFYAFTLGFKLHLDFFKKVPIKLCFKLSPQCGKLTATDLHLKRIESNDGLPPHPYGLAFIDFYDQVSYYEVNLSVNYVLNKNFNIGLSSLIQYMPTMKGISGMGSIDEHGNPPQNVTASKGSLGGAGRFLYSFSLFFQFNL